jgi:hypothetical protein
MEYLRAFYDNFTKPHEECAKISTSTQQSDIDLKYKKQHPSLQHKLTTPNPNPGDPEMERDSYGWRALLGC